MADEIDNDEIEDLKFQYIGSAEQVYKIDYEIHKLINNLDTLEKNVPSTH